MSILALAEAALLDPTISQGRLDGIEAAIRAHTQNRFIVRAACTHGVNVAVSGGVVSVFVVDTANLLVGDTVELSGCGVADGLHVVETITSGTVKLTSPRPVRGTGGVFPDGYLDLVQYPADVVEGVRALVTYDVQRAKATEAATKTAGVASKTVGRTSESYTGGASGAAGASALAGIYPAELLTFLAPYRRLSWGA